MATNDTSIPIHLNESVSLVALSALSNNRQYQNLLKYGFGCLKYTEPNLGLPTGDDTTTAILVNSIVAYWDFDYNLINKVDGTLLSGNVEYYDLTGTGNLVSSLVFENTKNNRFYLEYKRNRSYDDLNFLNDFTLSFWIKLSSNPSLPVKQDLFYKGDSIANYVPLSSYITYDQMSSKRYITFSTSISSDLTLSPKYSGVSINTGFTSLLTDNQWNHIGLVGNKNSQSLTTYVNGVSTNQITNWNPIKFVTGIYPFTIGSPQTVINNGGFAGAITQVAFWQRSLTKEDFLLLYNDGTAYPYPFGRILPRYFFHLFAQNPIYYYSRRYSGKNTISLQNSNFAYNNPYPVFNFDILGNTYASSGYISTLSANYLVSDKNEIHFISDTLNFDSTVNINSTYLDSLTANSIYATNIDYLSSATTVTPASDDLINNIKSGQTPVGDIIVSQDVTSNTALFEGSLIASQITGTDTFSNNITANTLNTISLTSVDLYANNLHGKIDLISPSNLFYNDSSQLSVLLENSYTFGVKPSDSHAVDDFSSRTINGAWDGDSNEYFTPKIVLKPFFQNIKAVFDYVNYYGLNGSNLNILIYDDIQEGVQKTGVDGGYSICSYGPNLSGAYYSTSWLASHHGSLGLNSAQFLWDLTPNLSGVDTFTYLTVPNLDFTSINIYGLYETGSKISSTKSYTFDKPFNLSPRKISFRTYICLNPSNTTKTFSSDPKDFTDVSADYAKHAREIIFEPRNSNVIIQNLCFEFETNAMDAQALYFNRGNYYLKNLTVAINGNGNYSNGVVGADDGANVYICGISQTDPYYLESSLNWSNLNQPGYTIPGAINGKYYPGYGVAIVGQQSLSNQPTWLTSFFNVKQNAKISLLDYNTVRTIGFNSQLNAGIILDGYFNANYFYNFSKNDSLIYDNNSVFRTTSFYLKTLGTNTVSYNGSNRISFTDTNVDNFYNIYFKGSYNIYTPHNYGLISWTFYPNRKMNFLNYDSAIAIDNGFTNDLYKFVSSKTIDISNMVKSVSAKNQVQKYLPDYDYDKIYNYVSPSSLFLYDYGYYSIISPFDLTAEYTLNYYSAGGSYYKPKIPPVPTPTPSVTVTNTPTVTPSVSPSHTASATRTPTKSLTPSHTQTATNTQTVTQTRTPPVSVTPTKTSTGTPQATPTITRTPAQSRTPTKTPNPTPTVTKTPKASLTPTPSITPTQTLTRTTTSTPRATGTVTGTPRATSTPTRSPKSTSTITRTPKSSPTPSPTPHATATVTKTLTPTPKATATITHTPKATPNPTSSTTNSSPQKPLPPVLSLNGAPTVDHATNIPTVKFKWTKPKNYINATSGLIYKLYIVNTDTGRLFTYEFLDVNSCTITDLPVVSGTANYSAYMTVTVQAYDLTSDDSNTVTFSLVGITPKPTSTVTKTPTPTVGAIYNSLTATLIGEFENLNILSTIKYWLSQQAGNPGAVQVPPQANNLYGVIDVVSEYPLPTKGVPNPFNPTQIDQIPSLPTKGYELTIILKPSNSGTSAIYSYGSGAALTISGFPSYALIHLILQPNTSIVGCAGTGGIGGNASATGASKGGNGGNALYLNLPDIIVIYNYGQIIGGGGGGGGGAGTSYSISTDHPATGPTCFHGTRGCGYTFFVCNCKLTIYGGCEYAYTICTDGSKSCKTDANCGHKAAYTTTQKYTTKGGLGGAGYGLSSGIPKLSLDALKGAGPTSANGGSGGTSGGDGGGYGGLTSTMVGSSTKSAVGGDGGASIYIANPSCVIYDGITKATTSYSNRVTRTYGNYKYPTN